MAMALPPQSSASTALRRTAGWPTHSKDHVTPPGPRAPAIDCGPWGTILRISSTASVVEASTKWVAPNWRARASLEAIVSTAMIREAPWTRSAWMTLSPIPPTPKTAAVSPGCTEARLNTAPIPVRTPQPMSEAEVKGTSLEIRTAWTSATIVYSAKTEAAAKFEAGSPS